MEEEQAAAENRVVGRDAEVTTSTRNYGSLLPAAISQCIDQPVHLFCRIDDVFPGQMHSDFDLLPPPAVVLCVADSGFQRVELNCGSVGNPELHGAFRFTVV